MSLDTAARRRKEMDRQQRSTRRSTGVVTSMLDATHAIVNIGSRSVSAVVPASVGGVGVGAAVMVREGNESMVESVLTAGIAPGSYWVGKASSVSLSAGVYRSADFSTFVRGSGSPDFSPVFDSHRFQLPVAGHWKARLKAQFDNTITTGNRLAGWLLNPAANTYSSSSAPSTTYRLEWSKIPGGSDFVTVQVEATAWLEATDWLMPIVRSTGDHALDTNSWESSIRLELVRTTP